MTKIFLLINKRIVVYGLLRRFTPRNDKGNKRQYPPHRHCDYETVIARLCRRSENLVIETTTHNPHRHCDYGLVIARIAFAICGNLVMGYCGTQPITVIARTEGSWQSQYGVL